MPPTIRESILDEFVHACHKAASHGLMRCSSGNLSLRVDDDRLLVTSSRSWIADISSDEVSVCRISDGALLDGDKPSVEIGFHAGILRTRPDVNVVMHFQTPSATTLACQQLGNTNYFVIPEIPFYIGYVARIPYLLPGSKELAKAVTDAMRNHNMVIMGNHGHVTVARDFDHAIQNAEFFELASDLIIRGGDKVKPLDESDVNALFRLREAESPGV